jgi:two-component system nitrogen regulation response regulator GlnG
VTSAKELAIETKQLSNAAAEHLQQLDWPGNVRQLENVCRWLSVMGSGSQILVSDLPPELQEKSAKTNTEQSWQDSLSKWAKKELQFSQEQLLNTALPAFEKVMIEAALKHTHGRRREAAELLGWGRNTLTRKINELGL